MFNKIRLKLQSNTGILILGTFIAQLIPIVLSPIFTRIYSPEDFGLFALYSSLVMIFSVVATGKYELAITLPKTNIEALNIIVLSLVISLSLAFLVFLSVFFFSEEISSLFHLALLKDLLYLLPLSIVNIGLYQSINYYMNRKAQFKKLALSRIVQSVFIGVVTFLFGFIFYLHSGLIVGSVFGQLIATILFVKIVFPFPLKIFHKISKKKICFVAKKHIKFPKFLIISNFINIFSQQLPIFLFSIYYSSAVVGYYMLSQRIVKIPSAIVANAIADLFRQNASYQFSHNGNCFLLYKQTVKKLLVFSFIPFIILFFIAPDLFSFIFGKNWRITGEYVQILIPMFFFQFLSNPLSMLTVLTNKQEYDLWWQSFFGLGTLGVLYISHYYQSDIKLTLFLLSTFYSLMYLIMLFLTYNISKQNYIKTFKGK